ncbi:polysaccharide deacetylase family protein [Sphingomonas sp. AX6]|uniref:polysaccharide deacetylase family protein n=1 Tax=Sphingomonas sp. AX6 TaxID=2653171 RepID=UPI0012F1052C|nr:polysaccharide deacetylase family protein [Sphingomonas sp. AX6]VXC96790.1 conserved hypothetical protein [Sphingomonas sp. AX6]
MTAPLRGYRPTPPSSAQRIEWPDDFGTRFTLMVDTEEEFDWDGPFSRDNRSTRAIAALPTAHRRFADRGIGVTYLVDHPIVTSPAAVDTLAELLRDGHSAIGAQLHPWVTPPFDEAISPENSFAGNLPADLELAKIAALTSAITAAFGAPPLIYRAGRYGIGPATTAHLGDLGYRIDSSVRAHYDYSAQGGPDFSALGNDAFRHADGIVELPLTTIFTGSLRRHGARLYPRLESLPMTTSLAARSGLLARVALTPEDMPLIDALEAVRVAAGEGVRLLNFSFHSPTVAPGNTKFVRDAGDLAAFHRWWDAVLDLLDRQSIRPIDHDGLIEALDRAR